MDEGAVPARLRLAAAIAWRFLVVAAAIAVLALALATLRIIFLPLVVALLAATLFSPPVQWLRERGIHRALATLAVLLGTLLLFAGSVALGAPYIADDIAELGELEGRVREGVDIALEWAVEGPLGLSEAQVQEAVDRVETQIREVGPQLVGGAVVGAVLLVEVIVGAILAIMLLFFFLHDGPRMWEWVTRLFPRQQRGHVDEMGQRVWTVLGRYLRAQVFVALVDAVLIGALLVILGIPLAVPLAILIFFGGFIPIIGAFVTGFLAVMVALASQGFVIALIVLGWTALVQQLEGNVLAPYIVGRYIHLHPAAVLLAVAAGTVVWGIPGAFIAAPLLATLYSAGSYLAQHDGEREGAAEAQPPPVPAGEPGEEQPPEGEQHEAGPA